jgi:D-alanyl-D-alanine carboxypeptidase
MKQRVFIRSASESDVDRIAMFCASNPSPGSLSGNLATLAKARCLLEARHAGSLAGVVGLDLERRAVAGPWIRPRAVHGDLGHRMLEAAERLAIQYGMTHLIVYPADGSASFFADSGYWKVAGGLDSSQRTGMARSIIRRSTRFSRKVREIAAELGIPADYGARHMLRLQPEAKDLESIGPDIYGREQNLKRRGAQAWRKMAAAAESDSVVLQPVSAFRTVGYQAELIRRKLKNGQSMEEVLKVSAAPGFSEHHSGRAIDVTTPGSEVLQEPFENTGAFEWLCQHAGDFGFTLSYPRGNPHGVAYEPWHWAYRK